MKNIIAITILVFTLNSCGKAAYEQDIVSEEVATYDEKSASSQIDAITESEKSQGTEVQSDVIAVKNTEKIIKTGNISLETENYDTSIVKIKQIIKQNDAYLSNENEAKSDWRIENTLTIRVTSSGFEKLISEIEKTGKKVVSKNIGSQDVSEEFVDIEARLKTKKETEERYREILKQARTINEILEVESYLKSVREEIESAEGRLKYLNDKVSYSTLTLYIYQTTDNPYQPGFSSDAGNALSGGWKGLKALILVIFYLWPLWIIAGVTLYFVFRKRLRKKNK